MENNIIVYGQDISKDILKAANIVLSAEARVAEGVVLGQNICIEGCCDIRSGCVVGSNTIIKNSLIEADTHIQSSYLADSTIGKDCCVGPFAHIHSGSVIRDGCRVGNFVEIKNSLIGSGCKIAHLTYVGDAVLGSNCNIGCGVVFCNYNGEKKQQCVLGDNVFVGSNTNLIAPVHLGDNSFVAAGSTINRDVSDNEFAIARARQVNKSNFDNLYINHINKDKEKERKNK